MKILGIDLGSRAVKIAIMEDGKITELRKISTMTFYRDYCSYDGKIMVDLGKLNIAGINKAISTGYGRNNTELSTFQAINEIKAHVYGSFYQTDMKDFVLLDVGGQDVKIMRVEKGMITDMDLNDKCAASCGRYLENMANVLEISVEEMSAYYENPVDLNSTCAVFSESELIGKIAEGIPISQLYASVNYSLYNRLRPLLTKFKGRNLVVSGGVANNKGVIEFLKEDYDHIIKLDNPQFNGAIGCCHYGNSINL